MVTESVDPWPSLGLHIRVRHLSILVSMLVSMLVSILRSIILSTIVSTIVSTILSILVPYHEVLHREMRKVGIRRPHGIGVHLRQQVGVPLVHLVG